MKREDYHELLKDGRWQRKRLEVMQRDNFTCTKCGTTNDLNVHHVRYIDGHKPWEYDNADLITLCGSCHKATHEDIERKERESEEYVECMWRAEQYNGLLLYYKQIGDFHDVITMFSFGYVKEIDLYSYIVPFYYRGLSPTEASYEDTQWMFSLNGFKFYCDDDGIKKVKDHIWRNDPDKVLTKEQFENVRQGLKPDEYYDECFWVKHIQSHYFKESEKRYLKLNPLTGETTIKNSQQR